MSDPLLSERKGIIVNKIYAVIPTRVVFVMLGFFGFNLVYAYKVVLSVALVAMVVNKNHTNNDTGNECAAYQNTVSNLTEHKSYGKFNWSSDQEALILGAFFYGYVLTQIPGALLAQRYGAKWLYGCALLITAILSLLGPISANFGFAAFFLTRLGQGLAEGVVFPCIFKMIAKWLPKMERSIGSTIIFTSSQIGTVLTLSIAGYLSDSEYFGGWPAIFYLLGIAGCVWFVFWALLVHESPDSHPNICERELTFIKNGQMDEITTNRPIIPWKSILTSMPVYALIITHFGQNWGFLTILTMLPTYFQKILHLDIKNNGLLSSLPYLLQAFCGWIAGLISDKIRKSGKFSVNTIRKCNNTIAFIGPAICLIGVTLSRCSTTLSVVFFTLAMGLNGPSFSGFGCTHVDMAPDFAAILMGITNTIANLPGFLAPVVANALTKNEQTLANWSYVFYLCSLIFVLTAIVYVMLASAQLQPWGISDSINKGKHNHSTHSTQQITISSKPNNISANFDS